MSSCDGPHSQSASPLTFYDAVGGHETFRRLVRHFRLIVSADSTLGSVCAGAALTPSDEADAFTAFLVQYWGGPREYARHRGLPRLPLRHQHVVITAKDCEAWLAAMSSALRTIDVTDEQRATLHSFFEAAARRLVNRE